MGQRVFQIAKDLRVDSRIIVRKLTHENLPPPGSDSSEDGWQRPWTPRSLVSVGLREMIREWHASGELQTVMETLETGGVKREKKSRAAKSGKSLAALQTAEGSTAQEALEAVAQIDREARQKKRAQLEGLRESRGAILRQIKELNRQIGQIDHAMQQIAGRPAGTGPAQYTRTRRDLSDLRERMGVWLESRRGEKFGAGVLAKEFPELGDTAVSYVLKALVEAGRIQTDASAGSKRPTYFAP